MIRRKRFSRLKFFILLVIILILPVNTAEAFLGDIFIRAFEPRPALGQAADDGSGSEIIEDDIYQDDNLISEDGAVTSALDIQGDEIVSDTCEIEHTHHGRSYMRCSKSKRFDKISGRWRTFGEIVDEKYIDGRISFGFRGKNFSLLPFIEKNGTKQQISDLSAELADQTDYQTAFLVNRRYTKWTSSFQKTKGVARTGYVVDTNLPARFVEEKTGDRITHLSLIIGSSDLRAALPWLAITRLFTYQACRQAGLTSILKFIFILLLKLTAISVIAVAL